MSEALDWAIMEAEDLHGQLPDTLTLVTDNGSSFIARRFRSHIASDFQHLRICYRTPEQLGLLERFHRSFKEEEVYRQFYRDPQDCQVHLDAFRHRYNHLRPHWALAPEGGGDILTPVAVYVHGAAIIIPRWQGWAEAAKAKLERLAS